MIRTLASAVAVLAAGLAPAAQAQSAPATTMSVPAPDLPTSDAATAREGWIDDCSHRLDAANQGHDGAEPFHQTCAAWLDYFQRAGTSAKQADGGLAIPVSMVRVTTMVPCTPKVVERKVYVTRHRHHDKRVWIAD